MIACTSPSETALLARALAARLSAAARVRPDEPLANRTTLRVGGPADLYVEPGSEADLAAALGFCREHGLSRVVLGRGSNLLVRDGGIRGVVICLAHPSFTQVVAQARVLQAGAGAKLKVVATEARRLGWGGLEFLEGIPGSVGGALRMNAGAMNAWTFEVVERVRFMGPDGAVAERPAAEVAARYRGCPLFADHIALAAWFRGEPADPGLIRQRRETFNRKRWESQPPQPSAGCIFKNPAAIPAGRLVDELGLKGRRVGGAAVSDVHANFIVNTGHATARDVLALIAQVQDRARLERGIELETEVEIIGADEPRAGGKGARG
jgi:UDP-N-acetylenolpyruvoylglucosamine reductase